MNPSPQKLIKDTLLIDNDVAARVLKMEDALISIESAFQELADGMAAFQPRTDLWSPTARDGDYYRWGSMVGAISSPPTLAFRFKSDVITWTETDEGLTEDWHTVRAGKLGGIILLVDTTDGHLLAIMNDNHIQHIRVGATVGVAAKYLSREDSEVLGILGSGQMARVYAEALSIVRPIKEIRIYSRSEIRRKKCAEELSQKLGIRVFATDTPDEALANVDIVATCTNAARPVYHERFLKTHRPGTFIVNVRPDEMDDETPNLVDKVVVTAKTGLFDYVLGSQKDRDSRPLDRYYRRRYVNVDRPTLSEIVSGQNPGREHKTQVIFYDMMSAGIQFAAVGRIVYEQAKTLGAGVPIPGDWFLQDHG
tara:strand:+ start:419 stop:1516 length:1098 start_codon:yes stop_codon:yes gene_type:complete